MKAAILCALLLTGCASMPAGVEMSEEEAVVCKEQTCSVWTRDELMNLAREMFKRGYAAGVKSI
jgi:hypothetical protein